MDLRDLENIKVEGVDYEDYPDFCDAYISYAEYEGKPLTEEELEEVNNNGEFVYECVINKLY